MKIFSWIKGYSAICKENKELRNEIKTLKSLGYNMRKEIVQLNADNAKLKHDYLRLLDEHTIQVGVDEENKIVELVRTTPVGFVIEKREKELK